MKKFSIVLLMAFICSCTDENKIFYEIKDNQVYYHSTFRKGEEYYMNAHYTTTIVEGADPKTFKEISKWYGADATHVYYEEKQLKQRDPSTFKIINKHTTIDKYGAYVKNKLLENSEGISFKYLSENYAKDNKQGYFITSESYVIIEKVDINSFKAVGDEFDFYAKDKNHNFHKGLQLKDSDPVSFEVLNSNFSKDNSSVYYKSEKIKEAHSSSFKILNSTGLAKYDYGYDAEDKNNLYRSSSNKRKPLIIKDKEAAIKELTPQ